MNIKVDDFVSNNKILYKIKELLLSRKVNNTNLFLAAKQGAGKFKNNIHMVINSRVK